MKSALRPKIRCREIAETDIDAVADLLTRGFVGRSREYWMQGLRRQAAREVPKAIPVSAICLRLADLTDTELVLYGP